MTDACLEGLPASLPYPSLLGCPRLEQKGRVGPIEKSPPQKKTDSRVKGWSARVPPRHTGACDRGPPSSKGREVASPGSPVQGPRRPGAGSAFSSSGHKDSRPSRNFEKRTGARKLELRRLMGLFIGAGGCLFWMPYKHPRYLPASRAPSPPLPPRGPRRAGRGPGLWGGPGATKRACAQEEGGC